MKHGKGIALPKKSETEETNLDFEEVELVKIVGNEVLVMRQVPVKENTVYDNANWRDKSYLSFKKRVGLVSEDYVGGIDWNTIDLLPPEILPLWEINGSEYVQVLFKGRIPLNIGRIS